MIRLNGCWQVWQSVSDYRNVISWGTAIKCCTVSACIRLPFSDSLSPVSLSLFQSFTFQADFSIIVPPFSSLKGYFGTYGWSLSAVIPQKCKCASKNRKYGICDSSILQENSLVQGENEKTGTKKIKVGGRNNKVKQEEILNAVNRLQKQQTTDPQESNNSLRN